MSGEKILLSHGSGGSLMRALISHSLLSRLDNPILRELSDSAFLPGREKIVFTTDSFVVSPLFFPGGDIGKLSVCGTVNDLTMAGAEPLYLSLALIIEEGLELSLLEKIIDSIAITARRAKVECVAGDLKVVEKGACDKIFINTSGIGRIIAKRRFSLQKISPGDEIILTGNAGEHGMSVLTQRKGIDFGFKIKSDCAALNRLLVPVLKKTRTIKFMRDPTRGGIAAALNEIAQGSGRGVFIDEKKVPLAGRVKAAAELVGIDPFYMANEGAAIIVAQKKSGGRVVNLLRRHPLGAKAQVIGRVTPGSARVVLRTAVGAERILDMPTGELLPRIC